MQGMKMKMICFADCEPLMNPVNGEVNVASSSPGNSAVFSCEPGYRLVGETQTCLPK